MEMSIPEKNCMTRL